MAKRRNRNRNGNRTHNKDRKDRVSRRRQELLERQQRMDDIKKMAIPVVVILVIMVVAFVVLRGGNDAGYEPTEGVNIGDTGKIEISQSEVTSQAKFYSHKVKGTDVRFFAVRGSDGEIRIAFDACDVCYGEKKGYRQAGDSMKCNNCGNEYGTDGLGTKNLSGGCWPSYLPKTVSDGKLIVDVKDLENKAYMFR